MKVTDDQFVRIADTCADIRQASVQLEVFADEGLVPAALNKMLAIEQHAQELRRALEGLGAK